MLRGSGKAALTENEDACRDLSGRRLRLVNADKKLQDWAASEKQRREEKLAARAEKDRAKAEYRAEAVQVRMLPACLPIQVYTNSEMHLTSNLAKR